MLISAAGKQNITLTVDTEIFAGYEVPQNFAQLVSDEIEDLLSTVV